MISNKDIRTKNYNFWDFHGTNGTDGTKLLKYLAKNSAMKGFLNDTVMTLSTVDDTQTV